MQVNLGARELMHPSLTETLISALRSSGLDPARLELEVTETQAPEDFDRLTGVLKKIHSLVARCSFYGFGTGYSSLLWLRRFPVSVVKLDRSFIAPLAQGTSDYAIVRSTIDLAHALGLLVVAEGIETTEQQQVLTDLHCDRGQGFHLARPMPKSLLRDALRRSGAAQTG